MLAERGLDAAAGVEDVREDLLFLLIIGALGAITMYAGLQPADPLPHVALLEECAVRCESRYMGAVVIDRGLGWECLCDPDGEG